MRALVTGVTGQDGSYLAEFLLEKGYEVWGVVRRTSTLQRSRIDHLHGASSEYADRFHLVYGDMGDGASLSQILYDVQPDEVYNLAAQSHVRVSFDQPVYTVNVDALGTMRLLETIRRMPNPPKYYQASSSEMFGQVVETPQTEATPFHPRSPYACAKVFSFHQTVNYREAYDLFAVNGILFNHESPRRGESFVTRKITLAAARIKMGLQDRLTLGNLDSKRDWGFAGDYVEAMWLMLQQERPEDFVIATGESHTPRDVLDRAFGRLDLEWGEFVKQDPRYLRPSEVDLLQGDASKAKRLLGWQPRVSFEQLIDMMVDADMKIAKREQLLAENTL